jgi:hypothetical protein
MIAPIRFNFPPEIDHPPKAPRAKQPTQRAKDLRVLCFVIGFLAGLAAGVAVRTLIAKDF